MGRTIESRQYEGGANYIAVQTQYDALGRAYKTSNPFRSYAGEQPIWTTAGFDALSRVISVTTPDSAVVNTSYSGNAVTVSDQTSKARKSVTDGLGRLSSVYEDPNGLSYQTSYSYDVLDDLATVNQGSQTRTFVYDSLKRLSSVTNPESGTLSYQYDNNGNVMQKTDARGVVTTFGAYDLLNRPTTKTYSDGTPGVTYAYDTATNGKGRLASVSSSISTYSYGSYDALGRALSWSEALGSQTYSLSYSYDLAGHMKGITYPSGHVVNYNYDNAGRLGDKDAFNLAFTGNLGDGNTRTYSTGINYSPFGEMTKEQFGTSTAVYNKLFYDSRGQLSEIRDSTTSATDTSWNRGAIINHYSNNCWGMCGGSNSTTSMTDNNGNLKKQEVYIPNDDQISGYDNYAQFYDYDSLNRLQSARENKFGGAVNWQQAYIYDRWGNRTIDQTNTWGSGIPKPNFGVDTSTNRLTAPGGYTMTYDSAGNLNFDNSDGMGGTRTYDAENRMKQAWANSQWQTYTYDGEGHRVKRNVNGTETWQVYGIGGELIAEYATNASPWSPQKEYGYRNGQLLVTAEPSAQIRWLVTDQLGTPRMMLDLSGNLNAVSRHDYLPFGEELYAGIDGRLATQGYTGDNSRQKFTQKERDNETGLDFFEARYYGSQSGRFTSPDPLGGHTEDPQTLNRYTYVRNDPGVLTDPSGLDFYLTCEKNSATCHNGRVGTTDKKGNFTATIISNDKNGGLVDQSGNVYTARISGQGVSFNGAGSKEYVQGVFLNGTNATTVQGSRMDGLEGFTFRFTYSDPSTGQTAAGSWGFNGNAYEARDALKKAGYFHYTLDALNFFHPSVQDEYAAVDYRSPGDKDAYHSGHFTIHVPVTDSYQPLDMSFIVVRIPKITVPTVGDVHFNEHNAWQSINGAIGHLPEIRF
jgi:RHS repeat-associated protein